MRNCQVDLSQVDYAANLVSIACIAADGFDRVYTVSVNEMTRFGGFIKIYRASLDGSQVPAVQQGVCSCCRSFALLPVHCSVGCCLNAQTPCSHGVLLCDLLGIKGSNATFLRAGASAG